MLELVFEFVFSVVVRGLGRALVAGVRRMTQRRPAVGREDDALLDFVGVITLVAMLACVALVASVL